MLVLDNDPKFWTDVKLTLGDEPEQTFRARFRVLDVDAYNAHDLETEGGARVFLEHVLVDAGEIADAGGRAVPFATARPILIAGPHTRAALIRAYHAGIARAALGN